MHGVMVGMDDFIVFPDKISICNKPLQQPLQLFVPVVVAVVMPRVPIFPFPANIMADFLFMTGYILRNVSPILNRSTVLQCLELSSTQVGYI